MMSAPGLISPGGDVRRGSRRGTLKMFHDLAMRSSRRRRSSRDAATRFGTVGRGRPLKLKTADLNMAPGGLLREDKALAHESYLTELLSDRDRRSVLLPTSRERSCWDTLIALLVSYTAIMLPIQLCYDNVPLTLPRELILFDVLTDVVFLFDIVLNFRTGYVENARVVVDPVLIRKRYLARWFAIDAIGSFPGDTIFFCLNLSRGSPYGSPGVQADAEHGSGGGAGPSSSESLSGQEASLLTLFKILKVPKLMRLGRLFKTLEKVEGAANVGSIILLLLVMVVLVHWLSCLWFVCSKGTGGWVDANGLDGRPWTEQYPMTYYTVPLRATAHRVP